MFHSVLGYLTEKRLRPTRIRDEEMKKFFGLSLAVVILGGLLYSCCKCEDDPIPDPDSGLIVSVYPDELTLGVGEEYQLSVSVQDNQSDTISIYDGLQMDWASSNPEIATVNKSGYVIGISSGSCVITATYNGKSGFCKLTVIEGTTNNTHGIIHSKFTYGNCSGGSFVDLPYSARIGDEVCFAITCAEDSKLSSVVVTKQNDANIIIPFTVEDQSEQQYCFEMPPFDIIVSADFEKR